MAEVSHLRVDTSLSVQRKAPLVRLVSYDPMSFCFEDSHAITTGVSGLPALAQLVSLEMAPIRCNVVIPGPVHTEILDAFGMGTPEYLETLKAKTTIGRVAGPHDT